MVIAGFLQQQSRHYKQGFQSNVLNWRIINPCINKLHHFVDKTFPCCSCWEKKQVFSTINNLFIRVFWFIDKGCIWFLVPIEKLIYLLPWYILQPILVMNPLHKYYMLNCYCFDYCRCHGFHWHSWRLLEESFLLCFHVIYSVYIFEKVGKFNFKFKKFTNSYQEIICWAITELSLAFFLW